MKLKSIAAAAIAIAASGATLQPLISNATAPEAATATASSKRLKDFNSTALSSHNSLRAAHGAPAMTQDSTLVAKAQEWSNSMAASGNFSHSSSSFRNGAGENLYVFYTTGNAPGDAVASKAVQSWYDEIKDYNFSAPGFSSATGHFTQVVWKSSTRLGCGMAQGTKTISGTQYKAYYVTCQYGPAGNVQGQFPANVLPK